MRKKEFLGVALMAVSLVTTGVLAQAPPGGGRGGGKGAPKAGATVEKIRLLKPNLYLIIRRLVQGFSLYSAIIVRYSCCLP